MFQMYKSIYPYLNVYIYCAAKVAFLEATVAAKASAAREKMTTCAVGADLIDSALGKDSNVLYT